MDALKLQWQNWVTETERSYNTQSLKYLLFGILQKKFTNFCIDGLLWVLNLCSLYVNINFS